MKTIESFLEEESGPKNIIKTLRVISPQLGYQCVKEILLEQVTSYRLDEYLSCNHISVLQNDFNLYFYRRIKCGEVPTNRLYKLDLQKLDLLDIETNQNERAKALSALEGYDIPEDFSGMANATNLHVIFACKFGYQEPLRTPDGGWQPVPDERKIDQSSWTADDKFLKT